VLVSRACLEQVGLFNPRLRQIADLDLWLRIMLSYRIGYISQPLSVYRHHGASTTATNARLARDWLDHLWLAEGLAAEASLTPSERASVRALRRTALRRAFGPQVRHLLAGRFWSISDFAAYASYRARALVRQAPPLSEQLPQREESATPRETPASVDPAPR
jgi:hypothetical protein